MPRRPRDWDDLLRPEGADRILIRYPLASSTMRTIWGALILRHPTVEDGYAWLARLAAEGPTWMQYWDENTKERGEDYLREQGYAE